MKKLLSLFLSLFIFTSVIHAQEIIENQDKPLSKNAGRVLKLKEVFRIIDIGTDYYFKYPSNLKVTSDGCFIISDEEQLLKFSPEGKFIKNLYKKGEGPGEIKNNFSYFIYKDEIYIYDLRANKIIHTDKEGDLIKDLRFKSGLLGSFLGIKDDWLIFSKFTFPPLEERKYKLYDVKHSIILISKNGETEKEIHNFPIKWFIAPGVMRSWAYFYSVLSDDSRHLFVSHTREYLIKVLDLKKGVVTRVFNRKYPRVKYVMKEWEKDFIRRYNAPEKKFEIDIFGLYIYKDMLWVKTSTKDKKKGVLIDVFNNEGKYIDNLYLKLNGSLMDIHGDSIFVRETDENENIQIVKYEIVK